MACSGGLWRTCVDLAILLKADGPNARSAPAALTLLARWLVSLRRIL
jgi:hypothetical protein